MIAHRGASASAPENTLAAFSTAIEMGVDAIELDVRMTRDGQLVVIHDASVDRTTDGTGAVSSLDLAEIKQLDAGAWFYREGIRIFWDQRQLTVPVLSEVLDLVRGRVSLFIELKQPYLYPRLEERLLETLQDAGMFADAESTKSVVVQTFSAESVRKLAALAPGLPRVQLLPSGTCPPEASLDEISAYAGGIGPYRTAVTPELVDRAHSRGLFVCPYTVNLPDEMRALLRMGTDGIISDNCVELKRAMRDVFPPHILPMAS